jgi:hypothetical protein
MFVLLLLQLLLHPKLYRNWSAMLTQGLLLRLWSQSPSILPQNLLKSTNLWRCIFQSLLHALKGLLPTCWFSRSCPYCRKCRSMVGWLGLWLCALWNNVKVWGRSWIESFGSCEELQNKVHWELLLHCFVVADNLFFDHEGFRWQLRAWLRRKGLEVIPSLGWIV